MNLSQLKAKGIISSNAFVPRNIEWNFLNAKGEDEVFKGTIYVRRRTVADVERMNALREAGGDDQHYKVICDHIRLGDDGCETIDLETAKSLPVELANLFFEEIAIVNGLRNRTPKN